MSKAYERGYQKAKFFNKGGAAYYQPGGEVSQQDVQNTPAQAATSYAPGPHLEPLFATDYNGSEWGFVPSPDNTPPGDLREFLPEGQTIAEGDLVHSNDNYLYVFGGPKLHADIPRGWYKSTAPAGTPPPAEGQS